MSIEECIEIAEDETAWLSRHGIAQAADIELAELRRKAALVDTAEARVAEQMTAGCLASSVPFETVQRLMLDFAIAWQGEVERTMRADLEKESARRIAEADRRHEAELVRVATAPCDRCGHGKRADALQARLDAALRTRSLVFEHIADLCKASGVDPETLEDGFEHLYAAVDEGAKAKARLDALTADGPALMTQAQVLAAAERGTSRHTPHPHSAAPIIASYNEVAREQLARCRAAIGAVPLSELVRLAEQAEMYTSGTRYPVAQVLETAKARLLTALSPQETANADRP